MNKHFLQHKILLKLGYEPTFSQEKAILELANFFDDVDNLCIFVLLGYAGTGKTYLISALIKFLDEIKLKVVLLAPTGRAAKVLTSYSEHNASTIHKCIYRKKSTESINDNFVLNYNKYKDTVFIVDEASMIGNSDSANSIFGNGRLLDNLLEFVFSGSNCRLILMGDPAQLPPVGTILSPALNIDLLKSLDMKVYSSELQEVVRQSFDSGILFNASTIRKSINIEQQLDFPKLKMNFPDIINLSSENILDEIQNSYSKYGLEETKIICKSNKAANVYNNGVRNRILWREEQISSGDLLMVVKNNYFWLPEKYEMDFIANGDILEVKRIIKTQDIYGYRFTDILVNLIDFPEQQFKVKVILDVLNVETASMPADYYKILYNKLYEDYVHLGTKKKINEAIFNDPFFNALQIKFAYALTCHKSQGGQWKVVFLDHEWLNMKKFTNEVKYEFFRWLYTAFTRATEKLYLVNFNVVFFE